MLPAKTLLLSIEIILKITLPKKKKAKREARLALTQREPRLFSVLNYV
ncbi:MAG TPA: hypothetical protein VGK22_18730 [Candidatus Angelobacter sp.]|jgi:hypothetical protein